MEVIENAGLNGINENQTSNEGSINTSTFNNATALCGEAKHLL